MLSRASIFYPQFLSCEMMEEEKIFVVGAKKIKKQI
jgi:hypothetical protein